MIGGGNEHTQERVASSRGSRLRVQGQFCVVVSGLLGPVLPAQLTQPVTLTGSSSLSMTCNLAHFGGAPFVRLCALFYISLFRIVLTISRLLVQARVCVCVCGSITLLRSPTDRRSIWFGRIDSSFKMYISLT